MLNYFPDTDNNRSDTHLLDVYCGGRIVGGIYIWPSNSQYSFTGKLYDVQRTTTLKEMQDQLEELF